MSQLYKLAEVNRLGNASYRASKRIRTATVGAISFVENYFGPLWGHGKKVSQRTPDELAWLRVWEECRKRILDMGNDQIRSQEKED